MRFSVGADYHIDNQKKAVLTLIILLVVAALVFAILMPNAFAADTGAYDPNQAVSIKSSYDQCTLSLARTQELINQTKLACTISSREIQATADNYKWFSLSTCFTLFFAVAVALYLFLGRRGRSA